MDTLRNIEDTYILSGIKDDDKLMYLETSGDKGAIQLKSATSSLHVDVGAADGAEETRLSINKDGSNISFLFKQNNAFIATQESGTLSNHNHLFDIHVDRNIEDRQNLSQVSSIFSDDVGNTYSTAKVFKNVNVGIVQNTGNTFEQGINARFDYATQPYGLPNGEPKELLPAPYARTSDKVGGIGFYLRTKTGGNVVMKSFHLFDQVDNADDAEQFSTTKIFPQDYSVFAKNGNGWIEIYRVTDGHLKDKRNGGYEHVIQRQGISAKEFCFLIREVHVVETNPDNSVLYQANIGYLQLHAEQSTRFLNNIDMEGMSLMNSHRIVADELVLNGETYTKMFRDVTDITVTEVTQFVREHQFAQMFNPSITITAERIPGVPQYIPILEYAGEKDTDTIDQINIRYDPSVVIDHLLDVSNIKAGAEGIAYIDSNHQLRTSMEFNKITISDTLEVANQLLLNGGGVVWDNSRGVLSADSKELQTRVFDQLYVFPNFQHGYRGGYQEVVHETNIERNISVQDDTEYITYGMLVTPRGQGQGQQQHSFRILESIKTIQINLFYLMSDQDNKDTKLDILFANTRQFLQSGGYYRTRNNLNTYNTETSLSQDNTLVFGTITDASGAPGASGGSVRNMLIRGEIYYYVDYIEYQLDFEILLKYISYEVRGRSSRDGVVVDDENEYSVSYYPPKRFMLLAKVTVANANADAYADADSDSDWDILMQQTVEEYKLHEPNRFYTHPTKCYNTFRLLVQDLHTLSYTSQELHEHHFGDQDDIVKVGCEFSKLCIHGTPKGSPQILEQADCISLTEKTQTLMFNDTKLHINNHNISSSPDITRLTINDDFFHVNPDTSGVLHLNSDLLQNNKQVNLMRLGLKRWDDHPDYTNSIIHSGYLNEEDLTVYSIDVASLANGGYSLDDETRTFNITRKQQGGIVSINTPPNNIHAPTGLLVHPTITLMNDPAHQSMASIQYQHPHTNTHTPPSYTINLPNKIPASTNKLTVKSVDNNNMIVSEWAHDPIALPEGGGEYKVLLPEWVDMKLDGLLQVTEVDGVHSNIRLSCFKAHLDLSQDIGYKVRFPAAPPSGDQTFLEMDTMEGDILSLKWVNQDETAFVGKNIFMGDREDVPEAIYESQTTTNNDLKVTHIQNLFVGVPPPSNPKRNDLFEKLKQYDIVSANEIYASRDVATDSDRKYKSNFEKICKPFEVIDGLNGYTFNRNDADHYGERRFTGLIAQEVQKVLPEAVIEKHDGSLRVMYGNLAGVFVEALKECREDIRELQRELVKLRLELEK